MVSQKKKGKKSKRRQVDSYSKKTWFDVHAPQPFKESFFCKTPVNKSAGMKLSEHYLIGRVFEVNASDLMGGDETMGHLVFKLKVGESDDRHCYTTFYGMRLTRDKLCSIVRKNRSLITTKADVKTTDGYHLRITIYCTAKRRRQQIKKTCFVHDSQRKRITQKMKTVVGKIINKCDVQKLIEILLNRFIEQELENQCCCIFPLCQTQVAKIKVLKAPKLIKEQIMKLHGEREVEEEEEPTE